jgi:hypothetical protein
MQFLYLVKKWVNVFGGLLTAVILISVLVSEHAGDLKYEDWYLFHQFNKSYAVQEIKAGNFPLWNPYIYMGRPFFADIETAVLYPLNAIFFLVSLENGFYLTLLIHFVIAYWAMAKVTTEWGADFIYSQLSGFVWVVGGAIMARANLGMLGYVSGLAWLPLALLYTERFGLDLKIRDGCKLVITLVLMLLAGHPHQFWTGAVILTVYCGVRFFVGKSFILASKSALKSISGLWIAYIFAFSISAIQVIPFLYLLSEGNRTSSLQFASEFSMSLRDLLGAAYIPKAWPLPIHENNYYVGLVVFILGFFGLCGLKNPRMRGLAAFTLVGVLVGLGGKTPFFDIFSYTIPGLTSFRLPGRLAVSLPLAIIIAFSLFASKLACRKLGRLLVVPFVLVIIIDVGQNAFRVTRAYVTAKQIDNIGVIKGYIQRLQRTTQFYPQRVLYGSDIAPANLGMLFRFSSPSGYCALASERVWQWLHFTTFTEPSLIHTTAPSGKIYRAAKETLKACDLSMHYDYNKDKFVINENLNGRAWLAKNYLCVSSYMHAIQIMSTGYDYRTKPLVENTKNINALKENLESVEWRFYKMNSLAVEKRVESAGLIVVAEVWYPGWYAEVDGVKREVKPVNAWMRGVEVLAGEKAVVFIYKQPGLAEGALVSLVSVLVLLYFWFTSRQVLR